MGRSKEQQNLIDKIGLDAYYELKRVEKNKKQKEHNKKNKKKDNGIQKGRSKKNQDLFDKLGKVEYYKLKNEEKNETARSSLGWYYKNKDALNKKRALFYKLNKKELAKKRHEENKILEVKRRKHYTKWKRVGMTFGDLDKNAFYLYLINKTCCDSCFKPLDNKYPNDKCLDHIHLDIPFNIRGIICSKCNTQDGWLYRAHSKSIYSSNYYKQQHEIYIMEKKREFTIENHLDLD